MPTLRRTPSPSPTANRSQNVLGLISAHDLIQESWQTFKRHWKYTFSISLWLLVPAVVLLIASLVNRFIQPSLAPLLSIISLITGLCINAWVNLRLMQYILKEEGEAYILQEPNWTQPIGSYIWLQILHNIALAGASLPLIFGMIGLPILVILGRIPERSFLFVAFFSMVILSLPVVWLAAQLVFWPFFFMTNPEGSHATFTSIGKNNLRVPSFKKSIHLFAQSYHLVRGRFWTVFARLAWPGLTFLLLFLTVTFTIDTVFALIIGEVKMNAIFETIPQGYAYFLVSIGQVLFLPLFITWLAKLFRSLKQHSNTTHAA
ncbi:hypothetical protein KBD61_04705 [Patescibacteria group bacterium]|nr:hypothetical protein [Patescibacteria group bacterium]MBP9710290.1 hypothetical protein [Patescibacteria group bacterium]